MILKEILSAIGKQGGIYLEKAIIEPIGSLNSPLTKQGFDENKIFEFAQRIRQIEIACNRGTRASSVESDKTGRKSVPDGRKISTIQVVLDGTGGEIPRIKVPEQWYKNGIAGNPPDLPRRPPDIATKPAEPKETVLRDDSLTVIKISGPHPGRTVNELAASLRAALTDCNLVCIDPKKRDATANGIIILRGGLWSREDVAALLPEMDFLIRGFESVGALKDSRFASLSVVSALLWELSRMP